MRAAAMLLAAPIAAQAQPVADPAVRAAADSLVPLFAGGGDYDAMFAPAFRQDVPKPRFDSIVAQMKMTLGAPKGVERFVPTSPWTADLILGFERGTASIRLALSPVGPHPITGLLITGTAAREDSIAKLAADVRALPGSSGLGIYALGGSTPSPIFEWHGDQPAPLGSAFKLWVLAEAARQVAAGERRWTDIVPLGPPSLPSGITQRWPAGTPMTLQGLATLMISISDNTATDTLLVALGRDKVDAMALSAGGEAPVLTTREAFAIKADPALAAQWSRADPAARRRLRAANAARLATIPIDVGMFGGKPLAPDVEWFASPRAVAALLDRLRRDDTARAILAVNSGIDPLTASRFAYVGFKGGSEPGVIAASFVVQAKDGRWYAVTGGWHRPDEPVEELRFMGLMNRALTLIAG